MTLQVLHPVAQKVETRGANAARIGGLEGKTIGLYWNHKSGGDAALQRLGELLRARFPGLQTRDYVGSIGSANRFVTRDDVRRISAECVAVVGSTAD
jgi:hypothetical protein